MPPQQETKKTEKGKRDKTLRIVLLAVPPAMEIDIIGPMSVFAAVNSILAQKRAGYKIELASTEPGSAIKGSLGLSISGHRYYRDIRGEIDTLLVVGGTGVLKIREASVLSWLRRMSAKVRRLGSVCSGAFLLARAGLLDGKRATTHWALTDELAMRYPRVTVDPNPIWVRSGNVFTSAGVTAGMDLALGFVEDDYGSETALKVARDLVLFLRRPGGQSQFSAALSVQASERKTLLDLQAWMSENPDKKLSVEALARRAAMSPRNFARVFVRELGITPARYVERLRIEAARNCLERTEKNLEEIASICGFGSAELMRRAFHRSLGITPGRYREHFGSLMGILKPRNKGQ